MFLLYLLWIVVVVGGGWMGWQAVRIALHEGPEPLLILNALLYLGCALYGLPKLVKLLVPKEGG
jgi:hypothetical protein